jgi:hypothetical protein
VDVAGQRELAARGREYARGYFRLEAIGVDEPHDREYRDHEESE